MKIAAQGAIVGCFSLLWTSLAFAQSAVLYDFTASWCGPCQQMSPIVHKLAREGFPVQQVDIDQKPDLARRYNISSIPAFVLVVNGQEVDRFVGRTTESHLRQMMAKLPANTAGGNAQATTQQSPSSPTSRGATGYEQPRLGNPEPFPSHGQIAGVNAGPTNSNGNPPPAAPQPARTAPNHSRNEGYPVTAAVPTGNPGTPGGNTGNTPVIRAQFDENNNVTHPTPHVDSRAANVRIRIRDDKGINYGSGTVIESRPGITYVLTCGHIFRNLSPNSRVDIDIFTEDRFETFVGKVEKYDLDADVGLVSLPTDGVLPVARLAMQNKPLREGENVLSIGCSGGQPPSTEVLNVTALNRYTGPDNVECTGVPVQGRSGGGLFNESNEVVGVCIAADPKEKRGLYAGLAPILELVSSCGLGHLIRGESNAAAPDTSLASGNMQPSEMPGTSPVEAPGFPMNGTGNVAEFATTQEFPNAPAITSHESPQGRDILQQASGARLTIVIEDPNSPGRTQVVIIPAATARLIADLTGELQNTRTVAAHRSLTHNSPHPSPVELDEAPLYPMRRTLREEDRSLTLPTDFSAAQPYRRQRP